MASRGIKVGTNVFTNNFLDQFLNTGFSTLKAYKWDVASFTTDGSGNATLTIPHGLNYAPGFHVERKVTASWSLLDGATYPNAFIRVGSHNFWAPDDLHHALHAYTDGTNLIIQAVGATPSTTYDFRYYIFVDLARAFGGETGLALNKHYGYKVAKPGIDVRTAEQYQLGYSSSYKALQYYVESRQAATLTLPTMNASKIDTFVEEGTYVDFFHGLGYPPLWQAEFTSNVNGLSASVPHDDVNNLDALDYNVSGFCDDTRIRVSFWRSSTYFNTFPPVLPAETIQISVLPFTMNLLGVTHP